MKEIGQVTVMLKVDEKQSTHLLPLLKREEEYFVVNPLADTPQESSLVRLDPTQLEKPSETQGTWTYKGLLLETRSTLEE